MAKKINIGIIGFGYIGKIHAQVYRSIPLSFPDAPVYADLKAVWRTSLGRDEAFIHSCGIDKQTTDLEEFFESPLDLVDVCTPTGFHAEFVNAALEHGKAVYCEKPLGKDLADAKAMHDAAKKAKVATRVAFVMRFIPAIRQMKSILDSGELGDVLNFRARLFHGSYLNPQRPMSWRLRFSQSGGGAFADLGAHMLDLVRYLLGDVSSVRADMRTFVKERPMKAGSSEMETVDVDDWATCTLEMENGAFGLVEAARTAPGVKESTIFQVFCEKGSLLFSANNPGAVTMYDLDQNKEIQGPFEDIPREDELPISEIWPSGKTSMGYLLDAHLACQYDFMQSIAAGKPSLPDFTSALKVQEILEAAYTSAADGGKKIILPMP